MINSVSWTVNIDSLSLAIKIHERNRWSLNEVLNVEKRSPVESFREALTVKWRTIKTLRFFWELFLLWSDNWVTRHKSLEFHKSLRRKAKHHVLHGRRASEWKNDKKTDKEEQWKHHYSKFSWLRPRCRFQFLMDFFLLLGFFLFRVDVESNSYVKLNWVTWFNYTSLSLWVCSLHTHPHIKSVLIIIRHTLGRLILRGP